MANLLQSLGVDTELKDIVMQFCKSKLQDRNFLVEGLIVIKSEENEMLTCSFKENVTNLKNKESSSHSPRQSNSKPPQKESRARKRGAEEPLAGSSKKFISEKKKDNEDEIPVRLNLFFSYSNHYLFNYCHLSIYFMVVNL